MQASYHGHSHSTASASKQNEAIFNDIKEAYQDGSSRYHEAMGGPSVTMNGGPPHADSGLNGSFPFKPINGVGLKTDASEMSSTDTNIVKSEPLDHIDRLSTSSASAHTVKTSSIAVPPKPQPDVDRYLNFEMDDDKKSVMPEAGSSKLGRHSPGSSKGRSASPKSESDSDEEDLKREQLKLRKPGQPMSIEHLPISEREALNTFEELKDNWYQNKQIGLAHQQEDSMQCECIYRPDDPDSACGSNCINRLTQTECLKSDCRCKSHCLNQRFQRYEYAPFDIVLTEKKGFGVRAREDMPRDAFVIEYLGDIISEKPFQKRMKDYFDEGVRHFYFMMLQKDEFIDATKRGGKGRFLNHSCAPNCYVAKWVVGRRLRMGIFTKRKIFANEELTFNYNVDRYGHEAQECFCGEPNCVGFIGGKTQTDVDGMDDLLLDALGITDEVDKGKLKGSKKKKSKKLDEDFNPDLTPIAIEYAQKVALACRQYASNRSILTKLLARILMTQEAAVQRQLMRLHGFNMMSTILHDYAADKEITLDVIGILKQWPLITRNKLMSTNIEAKITDLSHSTDAAVEESAQQLLEMWQALEMGYRIPKGTRNATESQESLAQYQAEFATTSLYNNRAKVEKDDLDESLNLPAFIKPEAIVAQNSNTSKPKPRITPAPDGWRIDFIDPGSGVEGGIQYISLLTGMVSPIVPSPAVQLREANKHREAQVVDVNDIISRVRAEAEAKAALEAANAAALAEAQADARRQKRLQKENASKEKKMYRLFSTIVVRTMSKYKQHFESEQFKRRAKEVCETLCDKEKKRPHYSTETYDALDKKSEGKIKEYVKEWVGKLLARKGIKVSSASTSSSRYRDKDAERQQSSHRHHRHAKSTDTVISTPETPASTTQAEDDEGNDMDVDIDDDLINSLVEDATGGLATPKSAQTPQIESPIVQLAISQASQHNAAV